MMLKLGATFDRYRVQAVLGEGAMGRVYRAYDTRLGRRVALKVLGGAQTHGSTANSSGDGVARMFREARAASMLNHPNAVAVYDVGEFEGQAWLAMECVQGRPLRAFVQDASVLLEDRLEWLAQIASVLSAAHACGIIHRDIKPENVMVRDDGVAKVLDFGIARRSARSEACVADGDTALKTLTAEGVVVGTPAYMAPEQLRGEPLDGRSDQFSWAVVAYELLTGALPWTIGGTGIQLVAQILSATPPPPHALNPAVPATWSDCVMRALAKPPTDRFPTMDDAMAFVGRSITQAGAGRSLVPSTGAGDSARDQPLTTSRIADMSAPVAPTAVSPGGYMSSSTSMDKPEKASARSGARGRRVLAVLALGAVLSAVGVAGWTARRRPPAQPAASSASAPAPTPMLSHALPATTVSEAAQSYLAAIRALHDSAIPVAFRHLERAVELDPGMAATHWRLGVFSVWFHQPDRAREAFAQATRLRAQLTERDREILNAVRVYVDTSPVDRAELQRRMRQLGDRYPMDEEVAAYEMVAHYDVGDFESMGKAAERALSIVPTFSEAINFRGLRSWSQGRIDDAMSDWARCIELAPSTVTCADNRAHVLAADGRCEDVEREAQGWRAGAPDADTPYYVLAEAMASLDKSPEAVREVIEQGLSRSEPSSRDSMRSLKLAQWAFWQGRFDEAEEHARALQKRLAEATSQQAHAASAGLLADVYLETRRWKEATAEASGFLDRQDAWIQTFWHDETPVTDDGALQMLAVLARAGVLGRDALRQRRDDWVRRWMSLAPPSYHGAIWYGAHGMLAFDRQDAEESLSRRDRPDAMPPWETPWDSAMRGRLEALAGHADVAIPLLERAARACRALSQTSLQMQSRLLLGRALEDAGQSARACAVYSGIARRWAHATPRSETAAQAKARMASLGCKNGR